MGKVWPYVAQRYLYVIFHYLWNECPEELTSVDCVCRPTEPLLLVEARQTINAVCGNWRVGGHIRGVFVGTIEREHVHVILCLVLKLCYESHYIVVLSNPYFGYAQRNEHKWQHADVA